VESESIKDTSIHISEDQSKLFSAIAHIERTRAEFLKNSKLSEDKKHYAALSYSAKNSNGDVIGGMVGWVISGLAYIEGLWVASEFRGRGIGKMLLEQIEAGIREHRCEKIIATSITHAEIGTLLTGNGYEPVFNLESKINGCTITYLVKQL
jgi:GNAT superfamily N-acetyltransferase